MKKILMQIFILLIGFNLVSCSTNTQKENTTTGVVAGGVLGGVAGGLLSSGGGAGIAVGAILGALVGGVIGHSVDSSDTVQMNNTMNNNPSYKSTTWQNKQTHARYTVTPTSNKMAINGNPNCRTYNAVATMNGKTEKSHGTACLQNDGTWQAVKV